MLYGKNRKWHPPKAGRRLAVRAAFAYHLYTRPRTPFCRCAAFPLKGKQEIVLLRGISPRESMSLDSRLALLPYESSFFATLKGKQEMVPLNLAPP